MKSTFEIQSFQGSGSVQTKHVAYEGGEQTVQLVELYKSKIRMAVNIDKEGRLNRISIVRVNIEQEDFSKIK